MKFSVRSDHDSLCAAPAALEAGQAESRHRIGPVVLALVAAVLTADLVAVEPVLVRLVPAATGRRLFARAPLREN